MTTTSKGAAAAEESTFDCEMSRIDQFEGVSLTRPRMLNVATNYSTTQLNTMALLKNPTVPIVHYKLQ